MLGLAKALTSRRLKNVILNSPKKQLVRNYIKSHIGGRPGCNLPWNKGIDNPMRFSVFYILIGTVGFGAPWLIFMHQMLRPYDYVVD